MSHIYSINSHPVIKSNKRKAKDLFKNQKTNKITLMQCQNVIAIESGFENWFHLQNSIKKEILLNTVISNEKLKLDFEHLLKEYLNLNGDYIHIQNRKDNGGIIKIRTIGELEIYKEGLSSEYLHQLSHLIYEQIQFGSDNKSNLDYNNFSFGSGIYNLNPLTSLTVKMQSVPVYPEGYDIVLKIINNQDKRTQDLESLGYESGQIEQMKYIMSKSVGSFIIAGTAGSGKTTTINSLMKSHLHKKYATYNINNEFQSPDSLTETPIDKSVINNVVVSSSTTTMKSFLNSVNDRNDKEIKNILREDPDVVYINELRDRATTSMVKDIIQSGHVVITTIHAASALTIIERLYDLNLSPDTLGQNDFLTGLCYQKLLPVVCTHCSHPVDYLFTQPNNHEKQEQLALLNNIAKKYKSININNIRIRNNDGCIHCTHRGVVSRTVVAEVITLDEHMRELIRSNKSKELYQYWRALSDNNLLSDSMVGKTIYEHALSKMLRGLICPSDILTNFGHPQ